MLPSQIDFRGTAAQRRRPILRGHLKPHGFLLSARVLEFPDGKPGDSGLFLVWGE